MHERVTCPECNRSCAVNPRKRTIRKHVPKTGMITYCKGSDMKLSLLPVCKLPACGCTGEAHP